MECLLQMENQVGESPTWCHEEQALYWVDIPVNELHRYIPSKKEHTSITMETSISAINKRQNGGFICAGKEGFFFYDWEKKLTLIHNPEKHLPQNRFNDGKCDRQGRFWAGTMNESDWDKDSGALYRLDPDLNCHPMQTNVRCSNGIGFSPDSSKIYFAESFGYAVYVYDFDSKTGMIDNRRTFAKYEKSFPDGLTVDREGNVWVAVNGEGKILRYSPNGEIQFEIPPPVPRPTSLCFGGEDLDLLYITSTRTIMTEEELKKFPLSGSLFSFKSPIKGLEQAPFAG